MSIVPAALAALTSRIRNLNLTGVQVFDGPPTEDVGQEVIAIGLLVEEVGIEGRSRQAGLRTRQETHELGCVVAVGTGDTDLAPVRERVYELFDVISSVIDQDRTLDKTVHLASITTSTYTPDRSEYGVVASIEFTVQITGL
jgi:hypothetical protein